MTSSSKKRIDSAIWRDGQWHQAATLATRAPTADECILQTQAVALEPTPSGDFRTATVAQVIGTGETATHLDGRVVLLPQVLPCGRCDFCASQSVDLCREQLSYESDIRTVIGPISSRYLCPIDDLDIEVSQASLVAGELSRAYALVVAADVQPGDKVVIVGGNTQARYAAALCHYLGIDHSVVADSLPSWLDSARTHAEHDSEEFAPSTQTRLVCSKQNFHAGWGASIAIAADVGTSIHLSQTQVALNRANVRYVGALHPDLLVELAAIVKQGAIDLPKMEPCRWPQSLDDIPKRPAIVHTGQ